MNANSIRRVWINPWKYYNFTASMSETERESVIQRIIEDTESGNEQDLKQYDFVCFENPYLTWRRERRSRATESR